MSRMSRHQQPSPRYGWLLFFIIMSIVIVAGGIWYITPNFAYDLTPDHFYMQDLAAAPLEVAESTVQEVEEDLITAETVVSYHIYYKKCDHTVMTRREQGSKGLIGLNRQQLENMFPAYTIEKFTAKEVILSRYEDSFCQDCKDYVFFGIKDGYIAIFYGKARSDAPVKAITDISITKFTAEQLQKLAQGITVENIEAEINTILEGLDR